MGVAILDENLMSSVFHPEAFKEFGTDEVIFDFKHSKLHERAEKPVKIDRLPQQEACIKALQGLTYAQNSKLKAFITTCDWRSLDIVCDTISSGGQHVFLEPVNGDISDLFTWIYGWSECALLVYLSSGDAYIAHNLDIIAKRAGYDLFTAAYLATGMKRDLYIHLRRLVI